MTAHAAFRAVVGEVFRSTDGPELVLESVSDAAEHGDFVTYSLVFAGPADAPLAQGTVALEHEGVGEQPIFLVPIEADAETVRYEAVFNRRRPAEDDPA